MENTQEFEPVSEERRLAVAEFIQDRLGIALRVINSGHELDAMEPSDDFQARSYQLDALARLWDRREGGQDKELLHLATGLGKTTVATLDMMKFQDECAQQSPPLLPRMLYVSHKNEINEQAAATVKRLMPDLETATFSTKQKELPDADVTFATFQSLHSRLDRFDPQEYEYIIWDEGHHTKAETYMKVVEHFDPLHETAITATPNRADGKDIREYFGEEVYSKGLSEAIAEGWLANVDYHIVFDKAIKNAIADGFNPKTLKDIKDLFAEKPPADAIANNIREEITKLGLEDPKTIIFCADIAEADEMADLLGGTAYHSDTKDRPQVLQDFREGRKRIIATRDMFNEGVDIPDAELIVFLRSTQSSNIFEQQLGRGLRRAPGKDKVYVLDFVANIERISKVRELGKAIQQRAEEVGEGRPVEEGVILGGDQDEPGLRIRSSHGNFDFDKLAVDLLEKFGTLYSTAPPAPEGVLSITDFSEIVGVSKPTLLKAASAAGLELPLFKFEAPRPSVGLDESAQSIIKDHLEDLLEAAEPLEEIVSVYAFADSIGMSRQGLLPLLDKYNIEPGTYKFGSNRTMGLTSAQQAVLRAAPEVTVAKPTEDVLSVNRFAKELGISFTALKNILAAKEVELPKYKFGPKVSEGLDEFRRSQVRAFPEVQKLLSPKAPDDFMSIRSFAKGSGMNTRTIHRFLEENNITLDDFKFGNSVSAGLSPEVQQQLLEFKKSGGYRKA